MKKLLALFIIQALSLNIFAQSISIDPNALQLPRLAVNPTCLVADKGKMIYNTTQEKVLYCNGTTWIDPTTGAVPNNWINSGNDSYLSSLTGRVGIGTINPVAPLTIFNAAGYPSTNYLTSATGTTSSDGLYVGISGLTSYVFNFENTDLVLGTNNSPRITISGSGNVGIGDTSPSQKLEVAGNTKIDGNLTVNNGRGIVRSHDATQMVIEDMTTPANINFTLNAGALIGPLPILFSTFTSTPAIAFGDTFGITNPQNLIFTIESVTTSGANIWIKNMLV
ncbi:MAG: hypothetical protein EAZ32_18935 [Cytophagia bacterium]|nr:MAG: hypothetical protein EAZ38_01685 [Cytophagales bacterium]TAG35012.1 MAG: hypothetical protein EAZ32_18935 [Cytophagia bacterium]TAG76962.1 MAG: hypothetical protein EAZ22_16680 [Cytophagales bacterium]